MKNNDPQTSYISGAAESPRQEQVIQVVEEFATIEKEIRETGRISIRKTVSEEVAAVNIPVVNETYVIERMPGSHEVLDTPPPALRYEGETMIIPVLKEITVVQKKYEVVEELHVTRRLTETPLTQEIVLRKEHVKVSRTGDNDI